MTISNELMRNHGPQPDAPQGEETDCPSGLRTRWLKPPAIIWPRRSSPDARRGDAGGDDARAPS